MTKLILPGDASAADVLKDKGFNAGTHYNEPGTMPNRGAVTITPGALAQAILVGYHNGLGVVAAVTFDASKVLTGTTIAGTAGTMPDHRGAAKDAVGTTLDANGNLFLNTPAGYYTPTSSIHSYEGNLADPKNWRQDRTMFGRLGTMPVINSSADPAQGVGMWGDGGLAVYPSEGYRKGGVGAGEIKVSTAQLASVGLKRYASGTNEKNASNETINYTDGTSQSQQLATITGIGFTPRLISVYYTNVLGEHNNTIYVAATGELQLVSNNASLTKRAKLSNNPSISINQNGFTIPVFPASLFGATFNWEAWE